MIARLLNQPVTIHHRSPGSENVRGNRALVVTGTDATVGYVEQTETTEVLVDRDTVTVTHLLVLFPDETIGPLDQVVVGGVPYEVVGQPSQRWNPRVRSVSHIEARLRVSAG